ncbi:MAG: amidase [Bryobacterales bacterium]|nr:amidase [Bryobacterales bacterium]
MIHWTLEKQRDALRRREISAAELLRAHQERIAAVDPRLRAFVRLLEPGPPADGPLAGVPLTIKDSFDVAGQPTLAGSLYRIGHKAANDSTAARKLRAAGAVLLGKTNCPEFLANYETDNHITGWTANPWNLDHTAGGSSGGEAAAIAAGCSAGGVGSDGGGSIRVPAHCCGIAGLKPTPGRVSAAGHFPEIAHPGGLLGVAGPMARTVRDVRILFEVLAGYDPADPFSVPVPLRDNPPQRLRIGLLDEPAHPAITAAVQLAAKTLQGLGHSVEPFIVNNRDRSIAVWDFFFNALTDELKRQVIANAPEKAHWTGLELLREPPAKPTGLEVATQLAVRDKLRASMLEQMADTAVLLGPPCAIPAWKCRERPAPFLETMAAATPWNLFGFPALVLPFGFTIDGLPVGIQLVGRPWEEESLLTLGAHLEQARGPYPLAPLH